MGLIEIEQAAQAWKAAFPGIKVYLGTNFFNWGWKGGPDYHERCASGQYYGDYWDAIQNVLPVAPSLDGVIADAPFSLALGVRASCATFDPSTIDWVGRIVEMEQYTK